MSRWLKTLRAAYGLDQVELAAELGVSRSLVGMWETGKQEVLEEHIRSIQDKFPDAPKVPEAKDRSKVYELSDPGFTASYPKVTMRYAGLVPTSDIWGDPLSSELPIEVDAKFDHPARFVCEVTGHSCFPALQQRDVTIWHAETNPKSGKIIIAQEAEENGCTVKEYVSDPATGRAMLVAINPASSAPPLEDEWRAIALLVGVIWEDEDGSEVSIYRPTGISPKLLLRLRGQ